MCIRDRPYTVHRLDKDTSGIFLIAKNRSYAQLLTTLFRLRKVHKTYLAICHGEIDKIKELLVQQIYSKVRWRETLMFMVKNGVKEFIEIGPGKVLSGLAKRIGGNINVKSINTIEDIKSLK